MERERSPASLKRGGNLGRLATSGKLASSTFVSRQRQLLEGHVIEGGNTRTLSVSNHSASKLKQREHIQEGEGDESPRSDISCHSDLSDEIVQVAHNIVKVTDEIIKQDQEDRIASAVNNSKGNKREVAEINNSAGFSDPIVDSPETRKRNKPSVLVKSRAIPSLEGRNQRSPERFQTSTPKNLPSEIARRNRVVVHSLRQRPLSASTVDRRCESDPPYVKEDLDTSLKLSLKGLSDSDEDEDDDDDDKTPTGGVSPRKWCAHSPYKSVLSSTKSFDTKKQDRPDAAEKSDSNQKHIPVIKQNFKLKSFSSSESLSDKSHTNVENPVKRTSSGRKLPIPNSKPLRPLTKCDSESSFLSIRKDGSTEYVALDLTKSPVFEQNSDNSDINMNSASRMSSTRPEKRSMDRSSSDVTSNGVKSPPVDSSGKPPLEKKPSRGLIQGGVPSSPRRSIPSSPRKVLATSPRKPASPRVGSAGKVSSSPRSMQPSPRTTPVVQARVSPRDSSGRTTPRGESGRTTPRDSGRVTPRESGRATPRGLTSADRRSSRENLKTNDNTDHSRKQTSNGDSVLTNATSNDSVPTKRRALSGGNLVSPRPGSPLKAKHGLGASDLNLQGTRIEEEPARPRFLRQESCSYMDLQQIISTFCVGSALQDCDQVMASSLISFWDR